MSKILLLDEITANQIAAGEVIERPASVIKELVENSIDAQADNINIYLEHGGINSIKVIDNGTGIPVEDAVKAFQRHTTSKIKTITDLDRLETLGFRGEALASISSVARVESITKTITEITGIKVIIEGGKIVSREEIAGPVGTSIKVKDLFFNTPARKKSLKSVQRELAVCNELIQKLSLANPSIGFSLFNNAKPVFSSAKGLGLKQRLFDVFGTEIAKEMVEFRTTNSLFEVSGLIGKSIISRNSRSHQAIFINKRLVKSNLISKAVEDGYHTYLMVNRHPIFVLNVSVNPNQVDVNVHPTKMEVRFDQEQLLYELIRSEVQAILGQRDIWVAPKISYEAVEKPEQIKLTFKEKPKASNYDLTNSYSQPDLNLNLREIISCNQSKRDTADFNKSTLKAIHQTELLESEKALKLKDFKLPYLIPLGQIDASYIACQGEDGLYLVDQHAAHERILFEKLMEREKEIDPAQQMLIPSTIELKTGYSQLLIENIVLFRDLGFIIEHFGGDTFIIRGVPQQLRDFNQNDLLLDLLDELKGSTNLDTIKIKEKIIIQISCKSAIKAGERLEPEEMKNLIAQLNEQENPYTCPHGRPIIVHISSHELGKRFKRIV